MPLKESKESLQTLIQGVRKFQTEIYPQRKDAYEQVVREGQKPHALFITCADSRIDPEALTQSGPGEIFVTRNIGNIVPAYGQMLGGVSAVIEYAVIALNVPHIVVCGHSDCGAIKGIAQPSGLGKMPTVGAWLHNADAALSVVEAKHPDTPVPQLLDELIEENVLLQLNHLRTHPSVAGRIAAQTLTISGWVYDIAQGDVRIYQEDLQTFTSVGTLAARS